MNPLLTKFPVTFTTLGWTVIDWIETTWFTALVISKALPSSLIWRSVRSSAGPTGFSPNGLTQTP
jgi:hypothetical protein